MLRRVDRTDTPTADDRDALAKRFNFRKVVRRSSIVTGGSCRASELINSLIRAAASGSSDRVGSSSNSTGGVDNIARATASRCLFPVDISPNRRRATSSSSSFGKQFTNALLRNAIAEPVQARKEHQVLLARQSPVKAALFSRREPNLPPHLFVMQHAVAAANTDRAGRRLHERRNDLRERRFARAVASDQPEDLTAVNVERNLAQRFDRLFHRTPKERAQTSKRRGVSLRQVANGDRGSGTAHRARCRDRDARADRRR